MAEETKVETSSLEVRALEIASGLVQTAYPHMSGSSAGSMHGRRWEGVDTKDDAKVRERLTMLAQLIADLKNELLK